MSFLRFAIKLSVVIVCAVGSFSSVAGFMPATSVAAPLPISIADPIASKLAEDSDLTGVPLRAMSPIYPTAKYTRAQLAVPVRAVKSKIVKRPANKTPMRLVYSGRPQVVAQAGPVFANVRQNW